MQITSSSIQVYLMLSANPRDPVETLKWYLEAILKWMQAAKLKVTPNKIEVRLVSRQSDLGFKVSPIWMGLHSPLSQLQLFRQLYPFLGIKDLAIVVHAPSPSRPDCCYLFYIGLPYV